MKLDLTSTFVVVQPDHSAVPVAVTPTIFAELDARFDRFKRRLLVSSFTFESDWSTWEIHPAGDEIAWHTARTSVPTKMLFVTPGEGTANKPI